MIVTPVLDNKAEIQIPGSFIDMPYDDGSSNEDPNPQNSTLRQGFEDSLVDARLNISLTDARADQTKIDRYTSYLVISNKVLYDDFEILEQSTAEVNGRTVGFLECTYSHEGEPKYSLIFITDIELRLAMFTFACAAELQDEWSVKAKSMMNSLKLTE